MLIHPVSVGQSLCLPQSCTIYNIQANDTCVGISAKNNLTYTQLRSWNPTINPSCTNLITGEYLCISQPGVVWNGTTIAGATGTQTALYATATVTPPGNVAFGKLPEPCLTGDCSHQSLTRCLQIQQFIVESIIKSNQAIIVSL
jgi:hypothetical protein